jgi:CPA2 family monovalent cation:H+ antiporter-2
MADIPAATILNFFIFLSIPFVFAFIAQKIKVSAIVGYIVGGLLLGNSFVSTYSKEIINNFAYFGIILLLFAVGLEVNFSRLIYLKKYIVLGGFFQIIFSIATIFIVSLFFGFSFVKALLIGIALSSSSTTLVAKIIQDRGEEGSFIGELAMGILMFQDIAFIPFLIIFTTVTAGHISLLQLSGEIFVDLVKSTLIIAVLFYSGQKLIPKIFNRMARTSRELMNLFVIVFIFLITYLSTVLGIPILIGIFVAGVLVGQTLQHYHIFSEIRPLRDMLAVIFFIFIGMSIKLGLVFLVLPKILLFTILIIVVKGLVILLIFLFFRFHSKTAFTLAIYLFQIDEDAFILMSQSLSNRVFSQEEYAFIISSVLITLVITPILINSRDELYLNLRKLIKKILPFLENFITHRIDQDRSPIDAISIKDHVIICGYGRVGSYVGRALTLASVPFLAIDYNFNIVEKARKSGANIIYGDPTDMDILDYAQADEARILVIAVPGKFSQEAIVMNAKKLNPKIVVFTRVHREKDQGRMKDLGVDVIIQPEFEASLSIIRRILHWKGLDKEEIGRKVKRLKLEHGML